MSELKRTPLHPLYKELEAKMVDFGGWEMPVQFSSIKKEHKAVRTKAGLFDVSHMGEVLITGEDSLHFLQSMLTNDLAKLKENAIQYSAMCNERGGVIDDLLVYNLGDNQYMLVVNAANTDKDVDWLQTHVKGDVGVQDVSDDYSLLAIQGPRSEKILQKLIIDYELNNLKFMTFQQNVNVNGVNALVSRTGYTGEDGFEIYCAAEDAQKIWTDLLEVGKGDQLIPCGLGARDTLRFEASLALYGQELSSDITPFEGGIGFAVKLNKNESFIGKKALQKQQELGVPRSLAGIEMIDRGIPRHGYPVFYNDEQVGIVTSGTHAPTLKKNIGLALIESQLHEIGKVLTIKIRNKQLRAKIVQTPFYIRSKK